MNLAKKARVTYDQGDVFLFTSSTTKDQIPRNVKRVRIDGSVSILPANIFQKSRYLVEVIFEEGAHTIGGNAFSHSKALAKLKLPSTLREISENVFFECLGLTSIDLPVGLQTIGEYAFYSTGLQSLEVPPTVSKIGGGALSMCHNLESIVLPPTLQVIEHNLFYACRKLEEIKIPETIKAIGYYAFCGCWVLENLDFSLCTECMTIGYCAFSSCSNLSVIHLPPNLKGSIERGTFAICSSLSHMRIPPGVNAIECKGKSHPFDFCKRLLSLELPEGLETIDVLPGPTGSFEFTGVTRCPSLVNLYMPPTQEVKEFGNRPFGSDFKLGQVAEDWGDLVARLQHRFDDLPLHRICYFHSYYPLEDSIRGMRAILQTASNADKELDTFGMAPLHILALAQLPKVELIQELLTSVDVALSSKDSFGSIPLEYLCKNKSEQGVQATRWLMHKVVEERSSFFGLDRWKQELLTSETQLLQPAGFVSSMSSSVNLLLSKLAKLEFLEVLSLLEMKLWKMKLEENLRNRRRQNSDRQSCRVHSGVSIVIENVLPFLGKRTTTYQPVRDEAA